MQSIVLRYVLTVPADEFNHRLPDHLFRRARARITPNYHPQHGYVLSISNIHYRTNCIPSDGNGASFVVDCDALVYRPTVGSSEQGVVKIARDSGVVVEVLGRLTVIVSAQTLGAYRWTGVGFSRPGFYNILVGGPVTVRLTELTQSHRNLRAIGVILDEPDRTPPALPGSVVTDKSRKRSAVEAFWDAV